MMKIDEYSLFDFINSFDSKTGDENYQTKTLDNTTTHFSISYYLYKV